VPKDLLELAMQSSWFKNSRYKKGRGKGVGGAGLGYRERPAIGFEEAADSQVGEVAGFVQKTKIQVNNLPFIRVSTYLSLKPREIYNLEKKCRNLVWSYFVFFSVLRNRTRVFILH
jgi:hypothetical protein